MFGACLPFALALTMTWSAAPGISFALADAVSQDIPPADDAGSRLLQAAMVGSLTDARAAIDAKANLEVRSGAGMTALGVAAMYGHATLVRLLLQSGANPTADQDGETPLMVAAREGHMEVVNMLLGAGVDVDQVDADGMTAVMAAAAANRTSVVSALAAKGANVNAISNQGATALIAAAYSGHAETVRALLDAGANPHMKAGSGRTALMAAAQNGSRAVGRILLDSKVDATAEDSSGSNAMIYAAANGRLDFVELLLDAGLTKDNDEALALSVRGCHVEAAERLFAAGARTTAELNGTPLMVMAGAVDCLRAIDLLLAHGAKIDARDENGSTALMHAAGLGRVAMVQLLLDKGADMELVNNDGKNAWQIAVQAVQRSVLAVLLARQEANREKRP